MNKYILLTIVLLTGCGGSSSTPITQPIDIVEPPIAIAPPSVPTVPDCPVCPEVPVVESTDTVEIVTYYQLSIETLNDDNIDIRTYTDNGYLSTQYNEVTNILDTYEYDDNYNRTVFTRETNSTVTSYQYITYDENNNILTRDYSNGMYAVYIYNEDNNVLTTKISYSGVLTVDALHTYDGENRIKSEYFVDNLVFNRKFDENNNLIYEDRIEDNVTTEIKTYTWQEFTEEIK